MNTHPCRKHAGHIAAIILIGLAAIVLFPYVVQLLWNHVLTDILPVSAISYWQALGLLALCKLLFGGFPGGRGCCRSKCCSGRSDNEQDEDECCRRTPGDREGFRQEMRRRVKGEDESTGST